MKRLVVNGDDFGLTERVNQGIFDSHLHGILTSATLLANGPAFDSAVGMARQAPGLGVGVHLNLTDGAPVSNPLTVPSLVDERGQFFGGTPELARRIFSGRVRLREIEREFGAQIERILSAGLRVTHLDGHKHVHMLPALFPIVVNLAIQFRVPGVRLAVERPMGLGELLRRNKRASAKIWMQHLRGGALALLAMDARNKLRQAGLYFPMYFHGITQTGFLDTQYLHTLLWNLPEGTNELMCHPGYADETLRATGTRLVEQRERELAALTRPETMKLVTALGIELVDYRRLVAP